MGVLRCSLGRFFGLQAVPQLGYLALQFFKTIFKIG